MKKYIIIIILFSICFKSYSQQYLRKSKTQIQRLIFSELHTTFRTQIINGSITYFTAETDEFPEIYGYVFNKNGRCFRMSVTVSVDFGRAKGYVDTFNHDLKRIGDKAEWIDTVQRIRWTCMANDTEQFVTFVGTTY